MQWVELLESIGDVDFQSLIAPAAKLMLDNIDWGGGSGEGVMYDLGIDTDDDYDPNDPELAERLTDWGEDRCRDIAESLEWLLHQQRGTLTIWREITAPANWRPKRGAHPGVYWSWDADAAEAHHGSFSGGDIKWLLKATVTPDAIDWLNTLAANAHPDYASEKEITLRDNAPVKFTYARR